jgi:hypothetical protein
MVHVVAGSAAAFLKESMRRDAMIGMSIVLALENRRCHQSLKGRLGIEMGDVHAGKYRDCSLKTCTR